MVWFFGLFGFGGGVDWLVCRLFWVWLWYIDTDDNIICGCNMGVIGRIKKASVGLRLHAPKQHSTRRELNMSEVSTL